MCWLTEIAMAQPATLPVAMVFIVCCTLAAAHFTASQWRAQRDDLSEYQLDRTVFAASRLVCASLAAGKHQAVSFSSDQRVCQLLICRLGWSGCRKCRNAKNSSLPLLLVRRLDSLGPSCCWRTFQHRVDSSVDFYRSYADYQAGFGQGEDANFWMGLEAIHNLTGAGDRRVRWEMSSWNGSWWWWENSAFTVRGSSQGYEVTVGGQDIDRSNVMQCLNSSSEFMTGQRFSTPDKDQDSDPGSCALKYQAGWWFNKCFCFNPNGRHYSPPIAINTSANELTYMGIVFRGAAPTWNLYPLNFFYSMKTFESLVMDFF